MWTCGVGSSVARGGGKGPCLHAERDRVPCPPGNCLLQRAAEAGNEAAALFLATSGAHVNHRNKWVSVTRQPCGLWREWQWHIYRKNRFFFQFAFESGTLETTWCYFHFAIFM